MIKFLSERDSDINLKLSKGDNNEVNIELIDTLNKENEQDSDSEDKKMTHIDL